MVPDTTTTLFIFEAILIALAFALVFSRISIRIARRINLIDFPGTEPHKKHIRPTPLAGGLALMITLVLSGWLMGYFSGEVIRATYIAILPVFFFGLWDDYKHLSPSFKLLGQIASAIILISLGVQIRIFESPEFFIHGQEPIYVYLDQILTIVWVVGITNAFNFVDSMDGLAVGLGGMAAAFFMLVTLDAQQIILSKHSALIIGACIGLYFFNAPPALLFLGDSGAQAIGFILAALAIGYSPQGAYQSSSWFIPIMLLGVPIFDTALIMISRARRNRPLYFPAHDHTYHRLLRLGLDPGRAVLFMQIAALGLSCLAFVILDQPPLIANTAFVILLLLGSWALIFLDNKKLWD